MNKQILHLKKLHENGGAVAVLVYLKDNSLNHDLNVKTFGVTGPAGKLEREKWINSASQNEFRGLYNDHVEKSKTGLSVTRLRAYSVTIL